MKFRKSGLLVLSTESEEININIGDEALPETPEEAEANDDEAMGDVAEADKEVEEVLQMVVESHVVCNTYKLLGDNIRRFGITREFLAIANADGELGRQLNLALPHFEEDGIPADISDDQLAEIPPEVAMEAIGERIKGIASKAKASLAAMGGKMKALITTYSSLAGRLNNKLVKVKDKVDGDIGDATGEKKAKVYNAADFKNLVTKLNATMSTVFDIKGTESKIAWGEDVLAMAGKAIVGETETIYLLGKSIGKYTIFSIAEDKTKAIKKTKTTLGEAGWNSTVFKGLYEPVKTLVGKLADLKKFEKAFDTTHMAKVGNIEDTAWNRDITSKETQEAIARWDSMDSAYHSLNTAFRIVANMAIEAINMYAMAAGKIVVNTAAPAN